MLTCVLQVGGVIYPLPPDLVFSPLHQKLLGIFWNASVTFPRCILATEPEKIFPISVTVPKFWWETKSTPDGEKLVSSVTHVRRAAGGKIWWVYPCFHVQSSQCDSSADFSWRHMQTGSRNPPKPEVVITRRCEDISTWSQRLRHSFRARPIHFHLRRHRQTTENTIRYKPEVETTPNRKY